MIQRSPEPDRRLFMPHVARNREPILAVLRDALPTAAHVLEIASGSGELARSLPASLHTARRPRRQICSRLCSST
jgi:hypothetical protein